MKKMIVTLTALIIATASANADHKKAVAPSQLPAQAQTFLSTHFKTNKIAMTTAERDWLDQDYQVTFVNGNKVEFDNKGNWESIDCRNEYIPSSALPTAIATYLNEVFPGTHVTEIERDRKGYEVELNTGKKLKFDKQCRVYKIKK